MNGGGQAPRVLRVVTKATMATQTDTLQMQVATLLQLAVDAQIAAQAPGSKANPVQLTDSDEE